MVKSIILFLLMTMWYAPLYLVCLCFFEPNYRLQMIYAYALFFNAQSDRSND